MEDNGVVLTETVLIEFLTDTDRPANASKIRKHLHREGYVFSKKDLNTMLYRLESENKLISDECIPPFWSVVNQKTMTFILVDCDNRQQCFKNACKVANKYRSVIGFANAQYNFYKPNNDDNCILIQPRASRKSISEVEMSVKSTQLCEARADAGTKLRLILVSGNKNIKTLQYVLEKTYFKKGISVDIATEWDDLKIKLE